MKIPLFATLLFFCCITQANAQVVLSEVYPAPTSGQKEWIELYNTSEETADISEWKLFEHFASKSELVKFTNTQIQPHEFLVFELSVNKLNNSEEKITLENTQSEEVSSLYFVNAVSEQSFSLLFLNETTIGTTLELSIPTPGFRNQIVVTPTPTPTPTQQPSAPIEQVDSKNNTKNTVETSNEAAQIRNTISSETFAQTEIKERTALNHALQLHKKLNNQLKIPEIIRIEKVGLEKRIPQLSYLVQKKVSNQGVISVIIGGSLLLFTGLLL